MGRFCVFAALLLPGVALPAIRRAAGRGAALQGSRTQPLVSPLDRYNLEREAAKLASEEANNASPGRRLDFSPVLINPNLRLPGNHGDAGVDPKYFRCQLDPKVTTENFPFFYPDIQRMWGAACGRNRGIFVLTPSDGHTYGCGNLPPQLGVGEYVGAITSTETPTNTAISALGVIIESMYNTSTTRDAGACDFEAMSMLTCGREEPWRKTPWADKLNAPIRAVNIGGLFMLERWILPGFVEWGADTGIVDQYTFSEKCEALGICELLTEHWKSFYSLGDFQLMQQYGLNAIRLPVGWWYFANKAGVDSSPYFLPEEDLYDPDHPITNVLRWARDSGILVILDLHGAPGSQNGLDNSGRAATDPNNLQWGESWLYSPENMANTFKILAAIAEYINRMEDMFGLDNVMALELLNEPWAFLDLGMVRDFYITGIAAIRLVRPHLPVLLHDSFRGPQWNSLLKNFPYSDVYFDSHIYHGFNIADAASDTETMDRQKQYVHESMACGYTSMLRYQTCSALPTFVGEFSLAIDNCMKYLDPKFQDFGQCDRLADRLESAWWTSHVRSFAMRQISMFERELGWAFWCWKVDSEANESPSAPFWSFQRAVEHGFIDIRYSTKACTHPAAEDYWPQKPGSTPAPVPSIADDDADDSPPAPSPATTSVMAAVEQQAGGSFGSRVSAVLAAAGAGMVVLAAAAALAVRRRLGSSGGSASAGEGASLVGA
ncbi:unnamed protein product [Phaeothamnion confervicola]